MTHNSGIRKYIWLYDTLGACSIVNKIIMIKYIASPYLGKYVYTVKIGIKICTSGNPELMFLLGRSSKGVRTFYSAESESTY